MTPRPFLSHILVTASAGGRNLVRGWYIFNMGSAKLFLSPLKGHDEDTAKKQHARSVEAQIKNKHAPHCKTPGDDKCVIGSETTRVPKEGTAMGTWNVRSLHACGRVQEITHELKRCRWET